MELKEILEFCESKHKYQKRRIGEPYIIHLKEVAKYSVIISKQLSNLYPYLLLEEEEIYAAALLHDAIEDTATDYEDILNLGGPKVANWVSSLSEDKRLPKIIRNEIYHINLYNANIEIKIIKLADIYSNLICISENDDQEWLQNFINKTVLALNSLEKELNCCSFYNECKKICNKYH